MQNAHERIIVSVGGSLIVPDAIDTSFLSHFHALILEKITQGLSFSIIAGGGQTARRYQDAAREIRGDLSRADLDWLGIHSTRLNGHLLSTLFREEAHHKLIEDPTSDLEGNDDVYIAAGWKPGWSTDYCAVLTAKALGAKRLVNLSNVDYVYDRDPRKNPDAKKIEKINWSEFRKIIPDHWDPGLSSPFDPVAAQEAESLNLEIAIINGAHLDRFSNYLDGKAFIGTTIS
jgi:uridylate kinase